MKWFRRGVALIIVAGAACVATYESTSQSVVTADQSSYSFGSVPIGMSMTSPVINIGPLTGSDDDNVTALGFSSSCPDFTLVVGPEKLPAHIYTNCGSGSQVASAAPAGSGSAGCTPVVLPLQVKFAPSSPGAQSCNVRVDWVRTGSGSGAGSGAIFVMVSGTGVAPMYALRVTPTTLPFGDVPTTTTSTAQSVTVTNTGTQPLTLSGTYNGSAFVVGGTLSTHTLAAGAFETHTVTCTPAAATNYMGTLAFTTTEGPMASVAMTCRGITTTLNVSPSPIKFAYALVGAPAPTRTVIIGNGSGSGSGVVVNVTNFRFTSDTSSEVSFVTTPSNTTLGVGSAMSIALHYDAATRHPDGPLGTLVFTANGTDQNIPIIGIAELASIGTNPASVEFGPVCANSSTSKPITIYANAEGTVNVSSISPPSSPQLSILAATGQLKGNHGNELTATTTVKATTAGEIDDKLTIVSDVPGSPMQDVALHATVLPAGVGATPSLVHFGPVPLDSITIGKEIVVSNCGSGPLMINAASVAGDNADEFKIVSPAIVSKSLAPTESMTFLVVMTPRSNGPKSAQLVVQHAEGMVTADLDGTGYGGSAAPTKDRETYYACSAGGRAGFLPILVALLALRRRRR